MPGVMGLVLKLPAFSLWAYIAAFRDGIRLTAGTSQVGCLLARLLVVTWDITGLAWPITLHGLL